MFGGLSRLVSRWSGRAELRKRLGRIQARVDESASKDELLRQIVRQQEAQRQTLDRLVKRSSRLERSLAHLVRADLRADSSLPFPESLTAARFRLRSQNDEDGMTYRLIRLGGVSTPRFVELGSGLRGGNSAFLVEELGWSGLMVDADEQRVGRVARRYSGKVQARAAWVTPGSINDLLAEHGFEGAYGVLSIDIDGADIWVWEAMSTGSPAIVIVEYNSAFGPERSVAVPLEQSEARDPVFTGQDRAWKQHYFGASLAALARVAARKGYRLVATEPRGVNAFFLRNDVAPQVPEIAPSRAFHLAEHANILIAEAGEDVFDVIERNRLALAQVS